MEAETGTGMGGWMYHGQDGSRWVKMGQDGGVGTWYGRCGLLLRATGGGRWMAMANGYKRGERGGREGRRTHAIHAIPGSIQTEHNVCP